MSLNDPHILLQRINLIFRCLVNYDAKEAHIVYYVRLILEYASVVWNPVSKGSVDKLYTQNQGRPSPPEPYTQIPPVP